MEYELAVKVLGAALMAVIFVAYAVICWLHTKLQRAREELAQAIAACRMEYNNNQTQRQRYDRASAEREKEIERLTEARNLLRGWNEEYEAHIKLLFGEGVAARKWAKAWKALAWKRDHQLVTERQITRSLAALKGAAEAKVRELEEARKWARLWKRKAHYERDLQQDHRKKALACWSDWQDQRRVANRLGRDLVEKQDELRQARRWSRLWKTKAHQLRKAVTGQQADYDANIQRLEAALEAQLRETLTHCQEHNCRGYEVLLELTAGEVPK